MISLLLPALFWPTSRKGLVQTLLSARMAPIPMANEHEKPAPDTSNDTSLLSPEVMKAIYGTVDDKKEAYEKSLKRCVRLPRCLTRQSSMV